MFTIEHDFDASIITLVDDEAAPGSEDIVVTFFDDSVTLSQADREGEVRRITFTMNQLADLRMALDLPEGAYRRRRGS